jgi:hypothetical protein
VSHALACPHGLSLINPERKLKFQRKSEYPVSQTRWSGFDRFSLRRLSKGRQGPLLTSEIAAVEMDE